MIRLTASWPCQRQQVIGCQRNRAEPDLINLLRVPITVKPLSSHSRACLRQIDATGAIVDLEDIGDPLRAVRGHSLNVKKAGGKHQR